MTAAQRHDPSDVLDLVAGLKALIGPALVPPDLARPDDVACVRSLLTLDSVGGEPLPPKQELAERIQAIRTLLQQFVTELADWPDSRLPEEFRYASCIKSSDPHQAEMQLLGEALTTVFQLNVPKPKKVQVQVLQTAANALYDKPAYPQVRWFARQRLYKYLLPWIAKWLIDRESQQGSSSPVTESSVRPPDPSHEDTVPLVKEFLHAIEHYLLVMTLYFSPRHKSEAHETLYVYACLLKSVVKLESRTNHEIEPFNGMSTEDAENLVTFSRLAADYDADDDNEVGPFNSRDQRVLVHLLRTGERVQFDLFIEDTPRGLRLMEKWNEWLGSCPCPRDRVVEPSSVKCRVHTQMDFCLLCLDLCNCKDAVAKRDWRVEIRERASFEAIRDASCRPG